MTLLLILEALLLGTGILFVWNRARQAQSPYGAPLGWISLAILAHSLLFAATYFYLETIPQEAERFAPGLPRVMWIIWMLQLARLGTALVALGAWFRIVKEQLGRRWLRILFFLCMLLFIIPDSFPQVLGSIILFILLLRLKWSSNLHGLARFGTLICSLIVLILLSFNITATITDNGFSLSLLVLSNSSDQSIVLPPVPESSMLPFTLTTVWDRGLSSLVVILRMLALVTFLRLLVVPVSLRGLSLKWRFNMTFLLFRIIPGLLGLAATLLIFYFGIGWQKARIAKMIFEDTLNRNLMVSQAILERAAPLIDRGFSPPPAAEVRRWLGPDSSRAHYMVRRFDPPANGDGSTQPADHQLQVRSTPGTPKALHGNTLITSWDTDSIAGLYAVQGNLYLAAARMRPDRRASGEVYVRVDSRYLSRIVDHTAADIKLEARPTLFITATTISAGQDSAWTDSTIVIDASERDPSAANGFLHTRRYLARTFLPVGNWLALKDDTPSGVVSVGMYTSIERLVSKFASEPYFFATNSIPILMVGLILLLFFFAEISAVRTGRSIARGILDDVKLLAAATKRFGEGDLNHRIPVRGRDELSTLANSFNTMAVDIQKHQEVLLEKERLEADLAVAREIQQRMLPQEPPVIPGLDVAGISLPSREVGGDLFSFLTLPNGNFGFALGDVSGKSVPAALLMSNTVAALKAETRVEAAADHVLEQMNKLIADQVEPGKFVTFFYGIVDQAAQEIHYSCAGHNPPLKMNAAGESEWIAEAGLPLGVFPDAEYTSAVVPFHPGDLFVLYSDGVTEAERNPAPPPDGAAATGSADAAAGEDEFFGEERMQVVVRANRNVSAAEIIEALLRAIRDYSGDAPQSDDVTIIVVKCTTPR